MGMMRCLLIGLVCFLLGGAAGFFFPRADVEDTPRATPEAKPETSLKARSQTFRVCVERQRALTVSDYEGTGKMGLAAVFAHDEAVKAHLDCFEQATGVYPWQP